MTFFRYLHCVVARDLAASLNESLENLGVLFPKILNNGNTVWSPMSTVWRQALAKPHLRTALVSWAD